MIPSQNTPYCEKADPVLARERAGLHLADDEKVYGLALSGGGIRSASFGLGFLQALVGMGWFLAMGVDFQPMLPSEFLPNRR